MPEPGQVYFNPTPNDPSGGYWASPGTPQYNTGTTGGYSTTPSGVSSGGGTSGGGTSGGGTTNNNSTQNGMVTFTSPSGNTFQVQSGSQSYQNMLNSGWTMTGGQIDNFTPEMMQNQNLQAAYAYIDQQLQTGAITQEQAKIFKDIAKESPQGIVGAQEILDTFTKIKKETIDPYYANQLSMMRAKFESNISYLQQQEARELEQERVAAEQNVKNAQAAAEESGLTFTGKGVEALGGKSAYQTTNEGEVPRYNRMVATSEAARRARAIQQVNEAYNPMFGPQGTIEQSRQQDYGSYLNQLIGNYRSKQQANTNQQYNFNTNL